MTDTSSKSKTGLKHIVVFGVTFTVGVTLGALGVISFQNFESQNETPTEGGAQIEERPISTEISDFGSSARPRDSGPIQEVLNQPSIFDQQTAIFDSLASATEQELKELWIRSQEIERQSHRKTVQHAILRKLATTNPHDALQLLDGVSIFEMDSMVGSLFSEWSISQLDEAIEAANTLSWERRKIAVEAILKTRDDLTEKRRHDIAIQLEEEEIFIKLTSDSKALENIEDPKKSWDTLLNDEVEDYQQRESLVKVAEVWWKQIGFEVLSKIYSADIEDYQLKHQLLRKVAEIDLPLALDYTRDLTNEREKSNLSRIIVRIWARLDAQAALLAISSFEPASLASILEDEVSRIWASTRPIEVIENIEVIPEELRIDTLESAFARIAAQDPLDALAKVSLVEKLIDNTSSIIDSIVREWSHKEPRDATEWVLENYTPEDPQHRLLLLHALPRLARVEPNKAFELAIEHTTDGFLVRLDTEVVGEILDSGNLELVKELIPRVPDASKFRIYLTVSRVMIRQGQTEESLELGKDLVGEQKRAYYEGLMRNWSRSDPKDLYESLDDLPTSDLKSLAAAQLISSNKYTPQLTDDQIEHAKTYVTTDD
ncbi:MAG: hypothetical protein F4219_04550 [Gammaproteobacteria bacterium]|nr:hypothetical protein [Gammaproteobacteria bacterium]